MKNIIIKKNKISNGFTLLEIIMTIVILSIVSITSTVFIMPLLQSYIGVKERVLYADQSYGALQRFKRDIKKAAPNSIRVLTSGTSTYIEFVPIKYANSYMDRAISPSAAHCAVDNASLTDNDILEVGFSDSCLTTVATTVGVSDVDTSDFLVINNLGTSYANNNLYTNGNADSPNKSKIAAISSSGGVDVISYNVHTFPNASLNNRFYIINNQAITYECNLTSKELKKHYDYNMSETQPTTFGSGKSAVLLKNITSCSFVYYNNEINQKQSVVSYDITMTSTASEKITMYGEVYAENLP